MQTQDRLAKEKAILKELYAEVLKSEGGEESKDEGTQQLVKDSKLLLQPDEINESNIRVMFAK